MATQTSPAADPSAMLAFSVYGSPGVYALLVGSGLSSAAGIPTGWDITLDLVRRVAALRGETDHADWADWYRQAFDREPDYSDLVAALGPSPDDRRAILQAYIEPTNDDVRDGRNAPTAAHRAIADLVREGFVRVIVTTNIDRLIETALRERDVEPTVIDSVDALDGAEPFAHTACYLVKLHGDYKDARIRNTTAELESYPTEYNALLKRILEEHGLIVCGWSGDWDEALRRAILSNPSRRYSLYWASPGRPSDSAERIIAHRSGHLVQIEDADGFLGTLRDQVRTLAQTRRQDPATVALLVGTAKRFASKPEHRIELHDLLATEVERVRLRLAESAPSVDADPVGHAQIVAACEAKVEPLGRVLGVLGRWGDGTETEDVAGILLSLWADSADHPGPIHLQRYPSVLLLWAYAVGLVLAKRWRPLHDLLSYPIQGDNGGPGRLVDIPARWFLDGNRNDFWKRLPGMERRKTPASDHLFDVLDTWRTSFAAVVANFEDVHDLWEILFALTFSETQVSEDPSTPGNPPWTHIGRNVWRHGSRRRILDSIPGELRRDLLDAGFFGGSKTRLAATVDSFSALLGALFPFY
ncbi:MAG: SIR2 family protein [Gammaproteobacteria bacterium]|nr:SIR2 family protein [Gammaproteobacteria bacterium]